MGEIKTQALKVNDVVLPNVEPLYCNVLSRQDKSFEINQSFQISESSESSCLDIVSQYSDAEIEMLLKNSFQQFDLPDID